MRTSFKLALSAIMLAAVFAAPADAKRRGGFGFFRMPSGEAVVLVKDLPNKPELRRDDGKYVDLGYHFTSSGGEWVGYVGSSSQYLPLDKSELKALMALGGLSKLPPEPKRPASSSIGSGFTWLLVGIGMLAILFRIFKGMRMMVGGATRTVSALRERAEAPSAPAFSTSIDDRIAQAAASYNSGAAAPSSGFQSNYNAPRPSFGQASAPRFGRR